MMKNVIKDIYYSFPGWATNVICMIPFPWRMGRDYRSTMRLLQTTQYWSQDQLLEYQLAVMRQTLLHAYNTVPYYKRLWDSISFRPEDLRELEQLGNLPLLSRKDVFEHSEELRNGNLGRFRTYTAITGGTTGDPVAIVTDWRTGLVEWAFIHTLWRRVGYRPGMKRITLTNVPVKSGQRVDLKYDPFHRELQLSIANMTDQRMWRYVSAIRKFRADFVYGFPSVITALAVFCEEKKVQFQGIKALLVGSEGISQQQVRLLEQVFQGRVYSWYGQTEKVALAGQCECSKSYHVYPEYGYTELVNEEGLVISQSGVVGEIVGTGFLNRAMPLVRYRTGDFAAWSDSGSCTCGRKYKQLQSVLGRRQGDILWTRNGQSISLMALDTQKLAFAKAYQLQFVQTEPGRVVLFVRRNSAVTQSDLHAMELELRHQAGDLLEFQVELADELIQTSRGKTPVCVQRVDGSKLTPSHRQEVYK